MDIVRILQSRIFKYTLPFRKPLKLAKAEMREREGLLIKLIGSECNTDGSDEDCGVAAWGEIAPLPGFSRETVDESLNQLKRTLIKLQQDPLPPELHRLEGGFENWLGRFNLLPAVRHGIEMAVLSLLANGGGISMARLLSPQPMMTIRVNGLITGCVDEVAERARLLQREGYRAVKLKVGALSPDEAIARTRNVFHELDSRAKLRLDANRAWTLEQALQFAEAIRDCEIEYIEEPARDLSDVNEFVSRTISCFPVALDESLVDIEPHQLAEFSQVSALILKPTILGGFERTAAFARAGKELGMKAVISSSFESSLGIAALGSLAAAYGSPDSPVGLDTTNWFASDLLAEPIAVVNGAMRVEQLARAAVRIDTTRMTEVPFG